MRDGMAAARASLPMKIGDAGAARSSMFRSMTSRSNICPGCHAKRDSPIACRRRLNGNLPRAAALRHRQARPIHSATTRRCFAQYGNSSDSARPLTRRDRQHLQRWICHNGAGGLAETQCARSFRHARQCMGVDGRLLAAAIFRQSGKAGGGVQYAVCAAARGQAMRQRCAPPHGAGRARTRARIPSDFAWRERNRRTLVCKRGVDTVKKRFFISLSLISLSLVFVCAWCCRLRALRRRARRG